MKLTALSLLALALAGCSTNIEWRKGVSFRQQAPATENKVVRVEVSSIGIIVGQNPATQVPEATIGYKRFTYTGIPTSTNAINVVPVRASIGVDAETGITENLETGEAAK